MIRVMIDLDEVNALAGFSLYGTWTPVQARKILERVQPLLGNTRIRLQTLDCSTHEGPDRVVFTASRALGEEEL